MTTREQRREEYSSSNVVRTLHPSRPLSPNMSYDDNNLDNLLDDLQTSVTRPGISPIQDTNYSSSTTRSRDVQYLSPSNSTTVVRERSISPGGEKQRVYKTAHYEYSTSNMGTPPELDVQKNINQLDSLLLDLKHERDTSIDRDHNFSNVGIDSGLIEPQHQQHVTKSVRTVTTTSSSDGRKQNVNRELQYDPPPTMSNQSTISSITSRQSRDNKPQNKYQKNVETKLTRDITYDSDPTLDSSSTSTNQRSYNYSKSSTIDRQQQQQQIVPYNNNNTNDIVEIDSINLPPELKNVPLSGDILPGPGTKVTTTIKTFTYEIPGEPQPPIATNKKFLFKNETYNTTNTTNYPERDFEPITNGPATGPGNQTIIYKNETYNTINKTNGYPAGGPGYPDQDHHHPRQPYTMSPEPQSKRPSDPPTTNTTYVYKKDTRETTTNEYPPQQYNGYPPSTGPQHRPISPQPPVNNSTIIYKHDVTNTNTNVHHPPSDPNYPSTHPYDPNLNKIPPHQPGGPTHTYLFKRETTNTTNTMYGPPGSGSPGGYPPNDRYPPDSNGPYPNNAYPPNAGYPPNDPSSVTTYKYSSTTRNTRNTHGGGPDEKLPLLAPAPFPTDGIVEPTQVDGHPPKRLDDLLANFDDPNVRPTPNDVHTPRKEVNTSLATGKSVAIVEPKVATKNIAGPPVYYPPGHELFAKSEQSGAAWRAQGGYAKGRGAYEYETSSKSKSSSKSGAAVVPVCLPLCCALPCVIM